MRRNKTMAAVLTLALALCAHTHRAGAKKPPVTCDRVVHGIGYYGYFFRNLPLSSGLDQASLDTVEAMFQAELAGEMKAFAAPTLDLKSEPFSKKDPEMVKVRAGGAHYEFNNHKLLSCQRGECGMASPSRTISLLSTSITMPPVALRSRHVPASFVVPRAVTYLARPSTNARPLR